MKAGNTKLMIHSTQADSTGPVKKPSAENFTKAGFYSFKNRTKIAG